MAAIIENVVEPVIEDPVIDIFADLPGSGSAAASRVPSLKSGSLNLRGRLSRSGSGVLAEQEFFTGTDSGHRTADHGLNARPDYLNFPRGSSTTEADDAGPDSGKLSDARSSPPDRVSSTSEGGTQPGEDDGRIDTDGSDDSTVSGGNTDDPNDSPPIDSVTGATVFGTAGDDIIDGGSGDDILKGETGGDTLTGGSGDDILDGGNGDDNLDGGEGDDELSGGAGNDALVGGSGYDSFVFKAADGDSGHDTIRLFNPEDDTLRFEEYGERLDAFSDLDTNANGVLDDGDAHVSVDAGNTVIDIGGQTDGDFQGTIKLVGVTGIEADDMSFS